MDQVYNVQTRQPEAQASDEELDQKLAAGQVSYPAGKTIKIVNDKGETATVPSENLQSAVSMGWKVDTPARSAVRQYVEQNEGIKGDLKVGLGQFADEALMGLPELIYDKTGDPLEVAKKEALKKEHDLANSVGGVGGFGASMIVGGPLWKGVGKVGEKVGEQVARKLGVTAAEELGSRTISTVAKDIAKRMVAKGAGGATEGLLFSAPHAITEAALGDPDVAAESLLAGGLIGGAFGGAGSLVTDAAKGLLRTGKKVAEATGLQKVLDNPQGMRQFFKDEAEAKAVESLNPILSQRERLEESKDIQKLGRMLIDEEIVTPFASKKEIYERLADKTDQIGKQMGDNLAKYDAAVGDRVLINSGDLASKIENEVIKKYDHLAAYRGNLNQLRNELEYLKAANRDWTLQEANAQKSAYGDIIKNWGMDQPVQKKFMNQLYGVFNKEIENKIGGAMGADELKAFQDLKTRYGYLEEAEKIAKKSSAREAAHNDIGLTSYITAGAGAGVMGLPGAVLGLAGREVLRRYGDQIASSMYNKAAGLLFAEQSMKKAAEKLDEIPSILKSLKRGPEVKPRTLGVGITTRLSRPEGRPSKDAKKAAQERVDNLEKLNEHTSNWVGNPAQFMEHVSQFTAPISNGGAPNIGASFNNKMTNAFNYLYKSMPKPPKPRSPFAPKYKFRPSDRDVHAFEQKLRVLQDPWIVFNELKNGTLTENHMEALKTVYPQIHQLMVSRVQQEVMNGVDPIPYSQRIKLSLLMDAPMDDSVTPQAVQQFQANYAAPDDAIDKGNAKDVKIAEDTKSDVQKLM